MNLDHLKANLCRQQAVIELIERSSLKAKRIACSEFYEVFDQRLAQTIDLANQNAVTNRLYNYLLSLTGREVA